MYSEKISEYDDLIAASKILYTARLAVYRAEDVSPAWDMLRHAGGYIMAQAEAVLRERDET